MSLDIKKIGTEQSNPNTTQIDELSTLAMVDLINREDQAVIDAVHNVTEQIATAIDAIYNAIQKGGRLVYIGAGTSGRLGVLDASECLPTFGVGEEAIIGIIAGGDRALRHPVEAAEDSKRAIVDDLKAIDFNEKDILCAIASSGRTPYCIGGIEYAQSLGAKSIGLTCVQESEMAQLANFPIEAVVGPEVITGSTRMKSGSAQKMILNMLSTGTMIKLGKVYGNLMVDLRPTNAKLVERARQMIIEATHCNYDRAIQLMAASGGNVKMAIVMERCQVEKSEALMLLKQHNGRIADLIRAQKEKSADQ